MKSLYALSLLFTIAAQVAAQQKPPAQSAPLVFTHVTLIDMTGTSPWPDMTVIIAGNRITTLGQTGRVHVPPNAQTVDATGKFLIPGLWDMHFHLKEAERDLPLFIVNGVTGVRNMGGDFQKLFRWRDEVASGRLLGPRIVTCGPVLDGPQPANPDHALSVSNAEEARQAVDFLARSGADFVKVYDGVPREAYSAIAAEAKKAGLPFVGHVPRAVTTVEASDAGEKSIEHLGTILEGCSTAEEELRHWPRSEMKPGDLAAIPRRIAARGTRMLDTYSEQKCTLLSERLARNITWQVPTLLTKRVQTFIDDISRADDPRLRYVPLALREAARPENDFHTKYRTPEFIAYQKRLFQKEVELVGFLHRAGVPFMTGTDGNGGPHMYTGFGVHDELALFVQAGFTPLEALQAATINPAKFLGESDSLGTIEPGKIANLVLLEANPLEDIGNTRRIDAVVVNGRYLPKSALQMMLANVEKAANQK